MIVVIHGQNGNPRTIHGFVTGFIPFLTECLPGKPLKTASADAFSILEVQCLVLK